MKRLINRVLAGFNLKLSRIPSSSPLGRAKVLTPYETALLTLLSKEGNLRVVQIGANDGVINDPLYDFVRFAFDRTEVVLIEPQEYLIPYLRKNYEFHPRKHVVKCAVGAPGEMELYAVKQSFWNRLDVGYAKGWPEYRAPTGITSSDREHVRRWLNRHLKKGHDVENAIVILRVSSLPLSDVLQSLGLSDEIDVLQIDAEGLDDQIIYNSSIGSLRPKLINFEACNLPTTRLDSLKAFLKSEGYLISPHGGDALAIRVSDASRIDIRREY